jgi:hypothetical protein
MVDIIDQFLLHLVRAIRVHGLLDCVSKPVLRFAWVDCSISALNVLTNVTIAIVESVLNFGVARILAEEVSPCSDHDCIDCMLLIAHDDFYGGP